jgi:hypothetical protein
MLLAYHLCLQNKAPRARGHDSHNAKATESYFTSVSFLVATKLPASIR